MKQIDEAPEFNKCGKSLQLSHKKGDNIDQN
jgi:hypothetical protein